MRFPLWLLSFIFLATMAMAAEDNIISTGDGDMPLPKIPHADISLKDGKATFQIDTTQTRAIQFQFETANGFPKIACGAKDNHDESQLKRIASGRWNRIDGSTSCSLEATGSTEIQVLVLNQSAAQIAAHAPGATWKIAETPKALNASAIGASLTFRSISSLPPADSSAQLSSKVDGLTARLDSFGKYSLIAAVLLMVLVIAVVVYQYLFTRIASRNMETMIIPRLESLSTKVAKLALQEDVNALRKPVEEMKGMMGRFASERQVDRTPKNETLSKTQAVGAVKVSPTESAVKFEQPKVVQPATAQEPVPEVLRILAQSYFGSGPGTDTAVQLDRKISDFLRQSRPATGVLQAPSKQVTAFISALEGVVDAVSSDEWRALIRQSLNEAWQLQSEIEDLQQPASNSLRLRFDFEFYTSSANRNGLMDGIGAGLKKQIAKLDKPVEYFDRQFRALSADTIQKAAEFLDTKVDRQRSNPEVQASLNELLRAGGLEQILPSPRQAFHSVEHKIVKVEPRPSGATEGPSIAQVVARGFRRGAEIVNPALVVVYE